MWNSILSILSAVLPTILSIIGIFVHFAVFHRLKCTKNLSDCLKECLPEYLRNGGDTRLTSLEEKYSDLKFLYDQLVSVLQQLSEGGKK